MFSSFFSKKKHPTDTSTEEAIQGPLNPNQQQQNNGADEFIFVERKTPDNPAGAGAEEQQPQHSMYPPMPYPPPVPMGGGMLPYPPVAGAGSRVANSVTPAQTPYLQDVPFELSPKLCTKSISEVTQLQVDGILAFMTRQMSVDESAENYNFTLERSIQNECY